MLSDLHARAHVAVAVYEEGESARQVFAAWQVKTKRGIGRFREICPHSPSNPHNIKEKNQNNTWLKLHFAVDTQKLMGTPSG